MRCAIVVNEKRGHSTQQHIFVGCTNGLLLKLDPVNFLITMRVKLKKHIFCMLQLDDETVLCGQLGGHLDLIRIDDGTVALSQTLKDVTGTIVSMIMSKTKIHEIILATQKGLFFVHIRRSGLKQSDVFTLNDFSISQPKGSAQPLGRRESSLLKTQP